MPMDRDLLLRTMLSIVETATPNTLAEILRSRAMLSADVADEVARIIRLYWDLQIETKAITDAGYGVEVPSEIPGGEQDDVEAFLLQIMKNTPPNALASALDRLTALDGPRATEVALAVQKRGVKLAKKAS